MIVKTPEFTQYSEHAGEHRDPGKTWAFSQLANAELNIVEKSIHPIQSSPSWSHESCLAYQFGYLIEVQSEMAQVVDDHRLQ